MPGLSGHASVLPKNGWVQDVVSFACKALAFQSHDLKWLALLMRGFAVRVGFTPGNAHSLATDCPPCKVSKGIVQPAAVGQGIRLFGLLRTFMGEKV